MVYPRRSKLGSLPDSALEWQHSASSSLLFVGPLQVPDFQHSDTEVTPLQLAPFASIRSQGLDFQPFVEGLQQGLAKQVEELAGKVEGTKRSVRNLTRSLRERFQREGRRLGLVHMQTGHKSCSEHDPAGKRGLLFASISESTSIPRRRKSQSSGDDGTDRGIQLVSSTTVVKKEFTIQDLLTGAIAGAAAGVSVETALYPIDTIKTRLQVLAKGGSLSFKGLYSGLSGNLAGVLPASALFVGIYEPVKLQLLDRFPERWSSAAHLLAAAAAGAGASIVRVPTEVIKQRMQTGQFATAAGAVRQILAKEGLRGMYAGYGSFLLRDLPFDAIEFVAYEQIKLAVQAATKRKELTAIETAFAGAVAGAVTGAVTTPLDVIKTRLMVQGTNIKYTGIVDCITKTVAEEGATALFKGVGPRVLWIGIGGSIFFGVLEKTKSLLTTKIEAHEAAKPTTVV